MPIYLLPYLYSQLVMASFSSMWVDQHDSMSGE
jgi:hypothetical protein